jgi:antitoxin (DNA-binding transcriptional repressor) of toxin-antitoxin stability system
MSDTTRITATELARNLSDILNRVRYRGESFEVLRNGEVVAELRPSQAGRRAYTVADFLRDFGNKKIPEGLGAAIEDARKALRPELESPWPC